MQKAWMLFISIFIAGYGSTTLAVDDQLDARFEKRIHSMYKSSAFQPVSDEVWAGFADRVDSESYSLRKGDTLWGLSEAFFGDGLYWPKVWSLNDRITNPHLIHPGDEIRFFSGTMFKAPGVSVVGAEEEMDTEGEPRASVEGGAETLSGAPSGESPSVQVIERPGVVYEASKGKGLYPGAPRIPAPREQVPPVSGIPPLFATSSFSIEKFDDSGVSFDIRPVQPIETFLYGHSYFYEGRASIFPSVGEVLEIEDGEDSTGFGGLVYIETESEVAVGTVFSVVVPDFSHKVGGDAGTVMRNAGEVQVTEALGSTRYRAIVSSALFPVPKGGMLSRNPVPKISDTIENINGAVFRISGGAYSKQRDLFATGSVIFIDGGESNGVRVGQSLGVFKRRDSRIENTLVEQSPYPIAVLKIFQVGDRTASAVILQSSEDVRVGDLTGPMDVGELSISSEEREDIDTLELQLDGDDDIQTSEADDDGDEDGQGFDGFENDQDSEDFEDDSDADESFDELLEDDDELEDDADIDGDDDLDLDMDLDKDTEDSFASDDEEESLELDLNDSSLDEDF